METPQVVKKKRWWKSKTIWFNVGTAILGVADWATMAFAIPPVITGGINLVGNLILRWVTDSKLTLTSRKDTPLGEPLPE